MGTTLISCRAGAYDGRREVLTQIWGRLDHLQQVTNAWKPIFNA